MKKTIGGGILAVLVLGRAGGGVGRDGVGGVKAGRTGFGC
jgi:hypothetical protein